MEVEGSIRKSEEEKAKRIAPPQLSKKLVSWTAQPINPTTSELLSFWRWGLGSTARGVGEILRSPTLTFPLLLLIPSTLSP